MAGWPNKPTQTLPSTKRLRAHASSTRPPLFPEPDAPRRPDQTNPQVTPTSEYKSTPPNPLHARSLASFPHTATRERAKHANGTRSSSPLILSGPEPPPDGVPHHHRRLLTRGAARRLRHGLLRRGLLRLAHRRRLQAAAPRRRRRALARRRHRLRRNPPRPAHPPRARPPRRPRRLLRLRPRPHEASGSDRGWPRHGGGRRGRWARVHRARPAGAAAAHGDQGLAPRGRDEVPRTIWPGITFHEEVHGQVMQCHGLISSTQVGVHARIVPCST